MMMTVFLKSTIRPWRVGEAAVLEHLQQRVEDVGVGLLDLVEEHDGERLAAHLLGELAALLVADVAGRRAEQPRDGVLLARTRDMSSWIRLSSSPKRNSASVLASSVLPTPVGPAKMNEPPGRRGSFRPARVRRIAWDSALMASSMPTMRLCSSSSMCSRREDSSSVSLNTGMPVEAASTSAISSSSTSATTSMSPDFHCFSRSAFWPSSFFSSSRRRAAFSKSWPSIADSFSRRTCGDLLVELAQVRRRRHPADAQPRAGLVDQVDRLVRQEAVVDVAVGEVGRRDQGRVGDGHAVVRLVAVAQALEDLDRVRERRLGHLDRLEPALERRVLLDVLAVLVERGRADGLQLAAGQHRLEDARGVDRALGGTRTRRGCGSRR